MREVYFRIHGLWYTQAWYCRRCRRIQIKYYNQFRQVFEFHF